MFKYRISVIVPIYNVEQYIEDCLKSLVKQTIDKNELEVLLINDGSPDNSEEICKKYCEKYSFFKYYSKENEGLSMTRNFGIQHAEGKYFVFLDPDDALSDGSLKNLADFFDKHEDEVDVVTYKIISVVDGKKQKKVHYRYKYLPRQGVYDVTLPENIYISQTNVNICVKNKGENNILFDTTPNFRHEDQKYNIDIIRDKMKIGYCTGAQYLYTKNPSSITNSIFYAYYIFDTSMKFWETLFDSFDGDVPEYFQALYINDINWKGKLDILFPYHYNEEDKLNAIRRICNLLRQVNDTVILRHPTVEPPHRIFMLKLKCDGNIDTCVGDGGVVVLKNQKPVFLENNIPFTVSRFKPDDEKVFIDAFLRSPALEFCESEPEIYAHLIGDGESEIRKIEPKKSSWDYYHAKIKTNKFYRVCLDWDYKKYGGVYFTLKLNGTEVMCRLEFLVNSPYSTDTHREFIFRNGYKFIYDRNGFSCSKTGEKTAKFTTLKYTLKLSYKKPRTFMWRALCENKVNAQRRIWLYYDCKNVFKDNAYYQFIHDFGINDGIEKYYVVNDDMDRSSLFTDEQKKHIIKFGSLKHRKYFLASEKIITAFAEHNNIVPFPTSSWPFYMDLFHADVIYLQHGVLHAFLPWKYSHDRSNLIDKEVVSTTFEIENLTKNYGFPEEALIKSGMPRYDFIDANANVSEKKILFAPTWRKYLISTGDRGAFIPVPDKFKASVFFKETYDFLHSEELEKVLEENDWYLDFKLHPIFAEYAPLYELKSKRIRIADKSVDEKSYKVFITDFSSFCFDFVYLKKTMMYFVPDDEMFRAGMNDYRKLDLPLEDGFGPLALTAQQAVSYIEEIILRNGEASEEYKEKTDGFFLHNDNNCRDRIYEALTE